MEDEEHQRAGTAKTVQWQNHLTLVYKCKPMHTINGRTISDYNNYFFQPSPYNIIKDTSHFFPITKDQARKLDKQFPNSNTTMCLTAFEALIYEMLEKNGMDVIDLTPCSVDCEHKNIIVIMLSSSADHVGKKISDSVFLDCI